MTLDEYRETWQRQGTVAGERADEEELLARVKRRAEAFDRKIFWRDVREIGAAVLVAGLFGWWAVDADAVLVRAGALVVVAGAVLVVWRIRRARSDGSAEVAARPVADRLRAEIRRVDAQIELLETVLWWYVAPPAAGLALMIVGGDAAGWSTLLQLAVVGVLGAGVWWLNRRAVRRGLRPRRRELVELLREVEDGGRSRRPGGQRTGGEE